MSITVDPPVADRLARIPWYRLGVGMRLASGAVVVAVAEGKAWATLGAPETVHPVPPRARVDLTCRVTLEALLEQCRRHHAHRGLYVLPSGSGYEIGAMSGRLDLRLRVWGATPAQAIIALYSIPPTHLEAT